MTDSNPPPMPKIRSEPPQLRIERGHSQLPTSVDQPDRADLVKTLLTSRPSRFRTS